MSLFAVVKLDAQWGVFAVNPNDSLDSVLVNLSETQSYAEILAADLNRIAEIEPSKSKEPPKARRIRKFRLAGEANP